MPNRCVDEVPKYLYTLYGNVIDDDLQRLAECGVSEYGTEGPTYLPDYGEVRLPSLEGAASSDRALVEQLRENDMDDIRWMLKRLQPYQRQKLDDHLDAVAPPVFRNQNDRRDWASQLNDASSDRLRGFLDWNAQRTFAINQDSQVQEELALRKRSYQTSVAEAVKNKYLLPSALSAVELVEDVPVVVGDIFTVQLRGIHGVYHQREHAVVITEDAPPSVYDHEMNHAALGRLPGRWNEVMTTHVQMVLHAGEPDLLDPCLRKESDQSYAVARLAAATALRGGHTTISPVVAIEDYCEMGTRETDAPNLREALMCSYNGVDVMQSMENWHSDHTEVLQKAYPNVPAATIKSSSDTYTLLNMTALSAFVRGAPATTVIQYLQNLAAQAVARSNAGDSAVHPKDEMEAFSYVRAVQNLEQIFS